MSRGSPGPRGMTCILEAEPSEMRISRLQDSCSARIHRRQCSGTSRHEGWFCRDTVPAYRLCSVAARWGAAAIPTHLPLCECSWTGSIAGASAQKQGEDPCPADAMDGRALSSRAGYASSTSARATEPTRSFDSPWGLCYSPRGFVCTCVNVALL